MFNKLTNGIVNGKSHLDGIIKTSEAEDVAQWYGACLVCTRPWVQFLGLPKEKNKQTNKRVRAGKWGRLVEGGGDDHMH